MRGRECCWLEIERRGEDVVWIGAEVGNGMCSTKKKIYIYIYGVGGSLGSIVGGSGGPRSCHSCFT